MIITIAGGVGLFLLGMVLMTDGLKALAGDSLRKILGKFAKTRLTALIAGAGLTVLVQSSHATTLAAIGFVSSGLLTFQQAIGVIIGANLGTTSTGWLVALLGFRFNIAAFALLFIAIGSIMKLLGRDRVASAGLVFAGFGLIFVGIDTLQTGMSTLSERIDPGSLPGEGLVGRLFLILFGLLMTVVMQSSSAAIATTLTALNTGAISLDQAAALVIGQNIGSAATAAIAAVGATVPAKRTALIHVLFNVVTGAVAFLILPIFVWLIDLGSDTVLGGNDELALAGFHTMFNLLGVAIFLPLTGYFSELVTRIVPDRGPMLTRYLDRQMLREPQAAIEAVATTLAAVQREQVSQVLALLSGAPGKDLDQLRAASDEALLKSGEFLSHLPASAQSEKVQARRLNMVHTLDHLRSLNNAIGEVRLARLAASAPTHAGAVEKLRQELNEASVALADPEKRVLLVSTLEALSKSLAEKRREVRLQIMQESVAGSHRPDAALDLLESLRWLDRIGFHLWRSSDHLFSEDESEERKPSEAP